MTVPSATSNAGRLGQALATFAGRALTDRELLGLYAEGRHEAAFAEVVRRHGRMVFSVCRRRLRDARDAEDACQAVFLVLARRGAEVSEESAGGWLHGVACKVVANLNRAGSRRPPLGPLPDVAQAPPDPSWREAVAALDEEVARLPDRYRAPVVLCYLEGRTRGEAARALGVGPGVLRGRLERGRRLLRDRLARRGIGLPSVLLAGAVADAARLPAALAGAIARVTGRSGGPGARVALLAEGVSGPVRWCKLKVAAGVLALGVVALGAGVLGMPPASPGTESKVGPEAARVERVPAGEVQFPDGCSVTLLRVERPALGRSWRPDGTEEKGQAKKAGDAPEEGGRPAYVVTLLVRNPPPGADPGRWSASFGDGAYGPALVGVPEESKELGGTVVRLRVNFAGEREAAAAEYGFAVRGRRTAAIMAAGKVRTFDWPEGSAAPEVAVAGIDRPEGFGPRARSEVCVRMPELVRWSASWDVLVVGRDGVTHHAAQWPRIPSKPGEILHEFEVAAGDVERVELRARYYDKDYRWATFRGVSLVPGRSTALTGEPGRLRR